jgi:long-chain acyl-CoA synthetase
MLLQDGLQNTRPRLANKVALICGSRRLTYADVDAMADRMANGLIAHGVRRGDRVALFLPNGIEAVISVFAVLKASATFVPIHPGTKPEKLRFILMDCSPRALISDGATARFAAGLFADCPDLSLLVVTCEGGPAAEGRAVNFEELQTRFPATRPPVSAIDLDLACLIYTSGSTGNPKGVMCDHASAVFVADSVMQYLENTEQDVILNVLPMAYSYGLYQAFMTFTFGGTLMLEDSFAYPVEFLKRIEQERATGFPGVPPMFAALLKTELSRFNLSSLRFCTNAAAALPVSHLLRFHERLPHVKVYSMYGNTESKRTLYLPPDQVEVRPGSVGIAIPGTEVWIEGEDGSRLGSDQVGELVVRGRHVMRGYWRSPQATAERFRPGVFPGERVYHTGDLFRMDEQGYLYFVARKDDIINTCGKKVAPKEVENVLHRCPGVLEAAVVGVPDETMGEAIKAVVVVDSPAITRTEILAHCKQFLEDLMLPKYFEIRAELPKTNSGKVLKRALI